MTEDLMDYPRLVQNALRGVARQALTRVEESGLPGAHHFYLSFRTDHPDVAVPELLRERYPDEMTVVLQHQYWDLVVGDPGFEVTLAFGGRHERVGVPWEALTAFYDPAVRFGVRFEPGEEDEAAQGPTRIADGPRETASATGEEDEETGKGAANVVSLDDFKKKK